MMLYRLDQFRRTVWFLDTLISGQFGCPRCGHGNDHLWCPSSGLKYSAIRKCAIWRSPRSRSSTTRIMHAAEKFALTLQASRMRAARAESTNNQCAQHEMQEEENKSHYGSPNGGPQRSKL